MAELDDGGVVVVADDVESTTGSSGVDGGDGGVGSDTAADLGVVAVVLPDGLLGDGNGD